MFNTIYAKTLYEKRWFLLAWAAGLFTMTTFTMIFYPYLRNSGLDELAKTAPKSLQNLLGDTAAYKTVPGYVGQQIFALRMPLMTIIMGIALFSSISAADESRGTLESLLAQPVSRGRVFGHKLAAGLVVSALAVLAVMLGVLVGCVIIRDSMSLFHLAEAAFGCWLITMVFGGLTYAVGATTGKKGVTIGVAGGLAFVSYMISSLAPAVKGLDTAQKASVFYYYNTPVIAQHGLRLSNILILVAIIAAVLAVGYAIFLRRDLVRD